MPLPFDFDFKRPDYLYVFKWRIDNLVALRRKPEKIKQLKDYYKEHPAQFITDWGVTYDPRNLERKLPAMCPFVLFPRQEEWVEWFVNCWKNKKPGLTEKSREMGMSWLTVAFACTICLFYEGASIGFGSRKEEYVDKIGDLKSLLQKARFFIANLPIEFRGRWELRRDAPHMQIRFPESRSIISGEGGDGIGRGDRTTFYIVDESAWLPRPELVEASLSQTTNCRHDISTPRGMNNPFARKRFSGNIDVFTFHWRDDPRKDEIWYQETCKKIDNPIVIAQEIDLDYQSSIEGIVIPAVWVRSAVDAHIKLGIKITGKRCLGFDIADEGYDKNALCGRFGILVEYLDLWSGKNSDIYGSVEKTFAVSDLLEYHEVIYDSDGLGAGAKGDARVINSKRVHKVIWTPFRGSGTVANPETDPFQNSKSSGIGRTNEDFFANAKAQAWFALRRRFELTYRAIVEKQEIDLEEIISISSKSAQYQTLLLELSQPTYSQNATGKIIIDKLGEGQRSPNIADAVMMAFAPVKKPQKGFFSG